MRVCVRRTHLSRRTPVVRRAWFALEQNTECVDTIFLSHIYNEWCAVFAVGKPAPDWNGTAVLNGDFQELRLADFKGKLLSPILSTYCKDNGLYLYCRKVSSLLFLSFGLVRITLQFSLFVLSPIRFFLSLSLSLWATVFSLLVVTSTFVCPTEILAFNDRLDEFHEIGTEVVACSVDSKYTHYAWINTPREDGGLVGLRLPLLSDLTKQIAKDYGVLLEDEGISLRLVIGSQSERFQFVMSESFFGYVV